MGMRATGTYSFQVNSVEVSEDSTFIYDCFYTDDSIDRIPFRIFADLTLVVNYLGIASHFVEEAESMKPDLMLKKTSQAIEKHMKKICSIAAILEEKLSKKQEISTEIQTEIHAYSTDLVQKLSARILQIYPQLGIKATHTDSMLHQIFCDFFTALSHSNFRVPAEHHEEAL